MWVREMIPMANTLLERTIGVGTLVKERRGLTQLAAQRPCYMAKGVPCLPN